jgi:hypothetical protein
VQAWDHAAGWLRRRLAAQPGYKARKEADKVSYAWDNLLGLFTASILAGEAEGVSGLIGRAAIALWNLEQFFHVADFKVGHAPGADLPCRV